MLQKVLKKIISIIIDILIIILILFASIISISTFTSKANDGVPNIFGHTTFSIQTDSMKPTINPGDYIIGKKCEANELSQGDIISFFTIIDGKRVVNTHRIVDITEENGVLYFKTQGDNTLTNPTPDATLVSAGDVISKYDTRVAGLGYVMTYLGTKTGFFIVVVLPILLFTLWEIFKLVKVILYNQKVSIYEDIAIDENQELQKKAMEEYLKNHSND